MLAPGPFLNPLCIALDVDSKEQALRLAKDLAPFAGGFKVGPRLVHRFGEELVQSIARYAPVFVDCKFFDIPSTMVAAVRATFEAGASACTIHAMAGEEALDQLSDLEKELNLIRPFRILAVTILTSWSEQSFPKVFRAQPICEHVSQLADLVKASGLSSVVCSPHEIELLADKDLFLLTPGIRMSSDPVGDQKRVMGPREALAKGSSCLVVGRPIIAADNPVATAKFFLAEANQT